MVKDLLVGWGSLGVKGWLEGKGWLEETGCWAAMETSGATDCLVGLETGEAKGWVGRGCWAGWGSLAGTGAMTGQGLGGRARAGAVG